MSWTESPSRAVSAVQPSQSSSARPSSRETIGISLDPAGQEVDHGVGVELPVAGRIQPVGAAGRVEEVGRGHVHGDRDVPPRLEAAGHDRVDDDLERLLGIAEPRPVAALVAHQRRLEARLLEDRADGAIQRDAPSRAPRCSSTRRPG